MAGEKPALKIFGKRKSGEGPEYVDIGAFWRNDRGLSGKWDKRIVAVKLEDGTVVKLADYYLNARATRARLGPPPHASRLRIRLATMRRRPRTRTICRSRPSGPALVPRRLLTRRPTSPCNPPARWSERTDAREQTAMDDHPKETDMTNTKRFQTQAAQGDLLIRRVDSIPESAAPSKPAEGRHIVAHSETGHHHYLAAIGVEYLTTPDPLVAYLRCSSPAELLHDRPWDTHAPILLDVGCYELRRQREYTPEGWRRVED